METTKMKILYRKQSDSHQTRWQSTTNIDEFISPESYLLSVINDDGTHKMPFRFANDEVVTMVVKNHEKEDRTSDRRTIVQTITRVERGSGKEFTYTRTRCNIRKEHIWSKWEELQKSIKIGEVSSLDIYTDSGNYSGVYTDGTVCENFSMLVIDNKDVANVRGNVRSVSQFKYSLNLDGTFNYKTRTGQGNNNIVWGSWVDIGAADTTDIQDNSITAQKLDVELRNRLDNMAQVKDVPMLLRKNYYNPDDEDFFGGYYLDLDGKLNESSGYCVTGYIPLNSVVGQLICTRNGNVDSDNGGGVGFFDENKQPLFYKSYQSLNGIAAWEYMVAYVRFSVRMYSTGHIQIEQGCEYTSKIGYGENAWNIELPNGYVETQSMSQVFGVEKTLNLLNPADLQKGKSAYISNGELKFASSTPISASGFIGVKPLTTYTFWHSFQYFFLDADKKVIGGKNELIGTATVTTPEDCRYLVINFYNERSGLALYNLDATARVYEGDVLYPYIPYGVASDKIQTYLHQQSISSLGSDALRAPRATVAANTSVTVNSQGYPHSIKNNQIVFHGKFDTFGTLTIGRGFTNNAYSGCRFEITGTAITLFKNDGGWIQQATIEHGLEINTYIKMLISEKKDKVLVFIQTLSGSFEHEFDYWGANGLIAFNSSTAMTDTVFSQSNPSFKCPVWMFGDSYYGADGKSRQRYWLRKWGYDNTLVQAFGGQGSNDAYNDLLRCLDFGTPKYLVWSLGMNDDNSNVLSDITTGVWYATYQKVKKICEVMDIELILTTIPEVRGDYFNKDAISEVVRNSGLRYIDAAKAVGSNANGEWYGNGTEYDYQSSDNVHPTEYGAKAIATQFLIDFPEIMQY